LLRNEAWCDALGKRHGAAWYDADTFTLGAFLGPSPHLSHLLQSPTRTTRVCLHGLWRTAALAPPQAGLEAPPLPSLEPLDGPGAAHYLWTETTLQREDTSDQKVGYWRALEQLIGAHFAGAERLWGLKGAHPGGRTYVGVAGINSWSGWLRFICATRGRTRSAARLSRDSA
jgi:hypothetical protein